MSEKPGPKRRHAPRGFLGMLENSKPQEPQAAESIDDVDRIPTGDWRAEIRLRQVQRLVRLAKDFNGTIRRELGPERAQVYIDEQREVAEARRRAQTNPDILDMRLD
jgi:hypothetical protein